MTPDCEIGFAPMEGDKIAGKNEGKDSIRREVIEIGGVAYRVTVHGKGGCTESAMKKMMGLLKIHTAVIANSTGSRYNENGSIGSDLQKERNE